MCLTKNCWNFPKPNFTYNIHDTKSLKLIAQSRLGLSHLGDHKFRHNSQYCVSPMCTYSLHIRKKQPTSSSTAQISNSKDSAIRWQQPRFWKKQNITDTYNHVYFNKKEIQLPLSQVNLNDPILSLLFYL